MRIWPQLVILCTFLAGAPNIGFATGGITPEQIYQPTIDWKRVVGTWEVLPEDNPLDERGASNPKAPVRTLMTLRKDGTCRIFDKQNPLGSDGVWVLEEREIYITLPTGSRVEHYVYGVKGDFMVTRSPIKGGKDQLWSRVK